MDFLKSLWGCFMVFFSIIDILGNAPIIIDYKNRGSLIESKKIVLVAAGIFSVFLIFGESALETFGLNVGSFSIAGSIILFFIGLELIFGMEFYKIEKDSKPSIVPIAFPLIAGPGSLTALMSLRTNYSTEVITVSLILNICIAYIVIENTDVIYRKIGRNGLNILKKIFGIVLLSFAIKIFAENFYKVLETAKFVTEEVNKLKELREIKELKELELKK